MRDKLSNIIIDVPERFIGRYKKHRLSIIRIDDDRYDYDIAGINDINISENIVTANNIDEVIIICQKIIDEL